MQVISAVSPFINIQGYEWCACGSRTRAGCESVASKTGLTGNVPSAKAFLQVFFTNGLEAVGITTVDGT